MVERDVALAKVAVIDRCLTRISEVRSQPVARSAIDAEDIVVLNLTRATQAAIDLASHVVSTEGYGLPDAIDDTHGRDRGSGCPELRVDLDGTFAKLRSCHAPWL